MDRLEKTRTMYAKITQAKKLKNLQSEKETFEKLKKVFGEAVFKIGKNAYGDRWKYDFGFLIKELATRYKLEDKAPAGYKNQYDVDIAELLEKELENNSFLWFNPMVGSWVHGWVNRIVYLPKD